MANKKIGILISGRGSNMVSLIEATRDGRLDADVALVISNIGTATGLQKARDRNIETLFITNKGKKREDHDREIITEMQTRDVELICLAGYMRLVSSGTVRSFPNRILNIHPSLLPAFPGLDAQQQALNYGVKVTGCTVHIVDEELDHGPIVLQRAVPIMDDDTVETLSARILEQEHLIYPMAAQIVLSGKFSVEGRRTYYTP